MTETENPATQPAETQPWLDRRRQQLADIAVARETERANRYGAVRDALRLSRGQRLGETIELTEDGSVTVAEVIGGSFGTVWRHLHQGEPSIHGYADQWTAILGAIARIHDPRGREDAAPHAARVLQIPEPSA